MQLGICSLGSVATTSNSWFTSLSLRQSQVPSTYPNDQGVCNCDIQRDPASWWSTYSPPNEPRSSIRHSWEHCTVEVPSPATFSNPLVWYPAHKTALIQPDILCIFSMGLKTSESMWERENECADLVDILVAWATHQKMKQNTRATTAEEKLNTNKCASSVRHDQWKTRFNYRCGRHLPLTKITTANVQ